MRTTPQAISPACYHAPRAPAKPREAVLVVLHHDGWVEVYGEHSIDVHIAVMPRMATPEGERLADEYLELTLPKRFRKIYFPGNRRAADMMRKVTPQDIAEKKWAQEMCKVIGNIAARNKKGGNVCFV